MGEGASVNNKTQWGQPTQLAGPKNTQSVFLWRLAALIGNLKTILHDHVITH